MTSRNGPTNGTATALDAAQRRLHVLRTIHQQPYITTGRLKTALDKTTHEDWSRSTVAGFITALVRMALIEGSLDNGWTLTASGETTLQTGVFPVLRRSTAVDEPALLDKPEPEPELTPHPSVAVNATHDRADIPDFYRDRPVRSVTLERTPILLENVFRVELKHLGEWFRLPIFGNLRICTGPDIPVWSTEQESYQHVTGIRITYSDGRREVHNLDVNAPITIAPF